MDTRDQALTKLTRLHDESHPTPHRPASLWRNYSLPVGSIMELAMEKGWWWRRLKIPLSGAPNGLQIWPPEEEQEVAVDLYRKTWWNFLSDFFPPKIGFYSVGIRVSGATRWAQPTRARLGGLVRPGVSCPARAPLWWFLAPVFFIYCKINLQKVSSSFENFYFCTKITPW